MHDIKFFAAVLYAKLRQDCIWHAEKAIEYRRAGNAELYSLHCEFLDQCVVNARVLRWIAERA